MIRIEVHQYIWTAPLTDRPADRESRPLARGSNGSTVLHGAAEQASVIDVAT
jgi:hypothetical protein